jgi:hypothetical protein
LGYLATIYTIEIIDIFADTARILDGFSLQAPIQNAGYSNPGAAGKLNEVLPRVTAIHD